VVEYWVLFTDDGTDDPDPPVIELVIKGQRVVVLFEDQEKLSVFARWAAETILEPGQRIAAVSVEFSSFEGAVQELRQADPTFDGYYMTDSHPLVTELAADLRQRAT
jgi:hypothetical protein